MSVVVKPRGASYSADSTATPDPYARFWARARQVQEYLAIAVGLCVVLLVCIDSVANNWAINDYIGNGYQFLTPIADANHANDLLSQYSFATGASLTDLSKVAKRMTNYTITNLVLPNNPNIYVLSAGTYAVNSKMNLCAIFQRTYMADLNVGKPSFGVAVDAISFLRGNAFTHVFTDDTSVNLANASMGHKQLEDIGYLPTRIQVDLRLSEQVPLRNTSSPQNLVVGYYRIYPKAYCTGCLPIAELGHGECNMTMVYNHSARSVKVSQSTFVDGSLHALGLMFPQTTFSAASYYLKCIAVLFALGGYLASRRTVQWQDVDVHSTETFVQRIMKTVLPEYYPHVSHALRFDMFCYNSDIFVLLFTIGVLLDLSAAFMYSREVQVFLAVCSNGALSLQLFALSTRLLWVNCGFLKLFKLLWSILSTATYSGESKLMGYLNFTGVTSLYLSAILLFYIPPFIEYNNHIRQDIRNSFERLDGTPVSYYESFYIRSSGAIVGGLLLNVLLAVGLDQLVNRSFWKLLATNSLARQAMYNSTSILMDYIIDIDPKLLEQRSKSNAVIFCKARRLGTLQWFLMSHLTTFGLPEKELRVKKLQPQGGASKNATQASGLLTQAETASEKSEKPTADRYLVVQDSGRHVHLLDADLRDVKNLVINIKILKNTAVSIY